jgi:hypothetical protein
MYIHVLWVPVLGDLRPYITVTNQRPVLACLFGSVFVFLNTQCVV